MSKKTPVIDDLDNVKFKKTLLGKYNVENPQEILNFIGDNKSLKDLLLETDREIFAYFPDALLYLDLFKDPEGESGNHLVLGIGTKLKADEALGKFDALIRNWFSLVMSRAKGRLSLDVYFE